MLSWKELSVNNNWGSSKNIPILFKTADDKVSMEPGHDLRMG